MSEKIKITVDPIDDDRWPKSSMLKTANVKNIIISIAGGAVVIYIIFKIFICGCGF
jgi:hypothetical protein